MEINLALTKIDQLQIHYIIAQDRTGSTLLSNILNHHPNVLCIIEQPFDYFLYSGYHKVNHWTAETVNCYCNDFMLFAFPSLPIQFSSKEMLKQTLMNYLAHLNFERVIKLTYLCFFPEKDKSKITTIVNKQLTAHFYIHRFAKRYPKSKFLFLRRLPIDNIARQFNLRIKKNKNASFTNLAFRWRYTHGQLLSFINKTPDQRLMVLQYEELIMHLEEKLIEISSFLEVEFDENMLSYSHEQNKSKIEYKKKELSEKLNLDFQTYDELHGGLTQAPNINKIGAWSEQISLEEGNKIWNIVFPVATKMGIQKHPLVKNSSDSYFFRYQKRKLRFIYTKLYYATPLWVKRTIRKTKLKLNLY